jgi:hypothetical protein
MVQNSPQCTSGICTGSLAVLDVHINDLPMMLNKSCLPVLFAGGTSILFTHQNIEDLNMKMNKSF